MAWYGAAPVHFDINRENLLLHPLPPSRAGDQPSNSTTRCRYRLRWNRLGVWTDFGDRVSAYWNTVSQADRTALVVNQAQVQLMWQSVANDPRILCEDDVKVSVDSYPKLFHRVAANGALGATLPSDIHSTIDRSALGAAQWGLTGVPDFVMHHLNRVTVLMEVKNPWLVTPQRIDEVINNTAPIEGLHEGRLAVEQLYGYMVHNRKTLGILTTLKGWCFFCRFNGGILTMTRMYGDFPAYGNITQGAAAEGYYATPNFTIMKALYYLSYLAAITNDTEEQPINGQPGRVHLPFASPDKADAAPRIQQPPVLAPRPDGQQFGGQPGQVGYAYTITGGYETADDFRQFHKDVDYGVLQFEPWAKENYLGPKNWIATVVSNGKKVVLKLWDAWKFDASARDQEVSIYLQLKPLWGKVVPSLYVSTPIHFFHALILQYVDASPISSSNLTAAIESEIFKSYDAIHSLNVIHGDVRAENILIGKDGKSVWIVDFEFSEILTGDTNTGSESKICRENRAVSYILSEIKHVSEMNGSHRNGSVVAP